MHFFSALPSILVRNYPLPPVIPLSPTRRQWHDRSLETVADELATDPVQGLSAEVK